MKDVGDYPGIKVVVFNATFNYIVAVNFNGGGNRSTQGKPPKKQLVVRKGMDVNEHERLSNIALR